MKASYCSRLHVYLLVFLIMGFMYSCNSGKTDSSGQDKLKGDLIVFHAGSLSVPIHQIADSFKVKHPGVNILLEAAGSKACARKITDLKKPCDVFASADYKVIENLLIPSEASWCIKFAGNEMSIVYSDKSKYAKLINAKNWPSFLMKDDVIYGRSDPESDPCGVRAVLTMQLSENYYRIKGLEKKLLSKNKEMIRPKETDLIALLETGVVDYIFLYRSVAEQHGFKYIQLSDSVNLKDERFSDLYNTASIEVAGKTPTERLIERGVPMIYGITIPQNSPQPMLAEAFVNYFLTDGMKIMKKNGQPSRIPSLAAGYDKIPGSLKQFAIKK